MQTKLSKRYGLNHTVEEYIDLIVRDYLPEVTSHTVFKVRKLCAIIDGNALSPKTQIAYALIFVAAREAGEKVSLNKLGLAAPNTMRHCIKFVSYELSRQGYKRKVSYLRHYTPQKR